MSCRVRRSRCRRCRDLPRAATRGKLRSLGQAHLSLLRNAARARERSRSFGPAELAGGEPLEKAQGVARLVDGAAEGGFAAETQVVVARDAVVAEGAQCVGRGAPGAGAGVVDGAAEAVEDGA